MTYSCFTLTIFVISVYRACADQLHHDSDTNGQNLSYDHALEGPRNQLPQAVAVERLPCQSLSGTWQNQHGSELVFRPSLPGRLEGSFHSIVGLKSPALGTSHDFHKGPVWGSIAPNGLLAFHVVWQNETSVTTWTGQCQSCQRAEEIIFTTWVLTEKQIACHDVWQANRIGQDIFKRQNIRSAKH